MARLPFLIVAASFALAACERSAEPAADENAVGVNQIAPDGGSDEGTRVTVRTSQKDPFGRYIVDGRGISLYMLEADTRGTGSSPAASTCSGECTREWPPLVATEAPGAGEQVSGAMLSTIVRSDGATQVTYNGWPLYRYHDDRQPSDTKGHAIHDRWGGWYLLAPSGEPIEQQ